MTKKFTHTRRLMEIIVSVGCMISLVSLLIGTLLAYTSSRAMRDAFAWVPYTQKVNEELAGLFSAMSDMDSGRQGYLLAGQDSNVMHYDEARRAVSSHLDRVRTLTSGNAEQESRATVLDKLVKEKMSFSDRVIDLKKQGSDDEARKLMLTDPGDGMMQRIRHLVTAMRNTGDDSLLAYEEKVGSQARQTEGNLLLLLAVDVLVMGIVVVLVLRLRRLEKFVTVCAWSKTIRCGDEWLSFENYLRKYYGVQISHGISEKEQAKFLASAGLSIPSATPVAAAAK